MSSSRNQKNRILHLYYASKNAHTDNVHPSYGVKKQNLWLRIMVVNQHYFFFDTEHNFIPNG